MRASRWLALILTAAFLVAVGSFVFGPEPSHPEERDPGTDAAKPLLSIETEANQGSARESVVSDRRSPVAPSARRADEPSAGQASRGRDAAKERTPGTREPRLEALAIRFAREDPAAGTAFFEELLREGDRSSARTFLRAFSPAWAGQDPAAALAWVEGLPMVDRYAATYGLIMEGAKQDRALIRSWILELPEGPYKTRTVDLYGQFLAVYDGGPEDAEWAWTLLRDADDPAPFMPVVARELTRADPDWTYDYLVGLDDGIAQHRGLRSFVEELARQDPKPAFRWACRFEDPGLRFELSQIALQTWGSVAPREAGRWLLDSGEAEFFDDWVSALAPSLMEADADLLNELLEDPRLDPERRHYLQHVFP